MVTIYNAKFTEMWHVPPELVASKADSRLLEFVMSQLMAPEAFLSKVRELYSNAQAHSFDVLEFKDGRVFERYSQPQRLGGKCAGRVWCFRDISARKKAESELAQAHRRLVEASRQAGMAEVATSVLHNVGNVLNSVNVSATLVRDTLRRSRLQSLAKVAELLAGHSEDLHQFLAHDAKGKILPRFLKELVGHMASQEQSLIQEMDSLRKNIEHIKVIVSTQQSHAKTCGALETLDLKEVVEDALQINQPGFDLRQVQVRRDFRPAPQVLVDRHKVLQILVNLLANAQHALEQTAAPERNVSVSLYAGEAGRACLSVEDNGVGIEPENLKRIFIHGFTTRKNGHGFGLHNGANAAKEMNGSLSVHSEGPGKGATFTLELPAAENGERDRV